MADEIYNPNRRYKAFRPRQAARGMKIIPTPVNFATVYIFNNTLGAQYLVLRDLTINATANDTIAVSNALGQLGVGPGKVDQMVPSMGTQIGVITSNDVATAVPADYTIATSSFGVWIWQHDFPFAILEPGWSLILQDTTTTHGLTVSAVWESITTEELDWSW